MSCVLSSFIWMYSTLCRLSSCIAIDCPVYALESLVRLSSTLSLYIYSLVFPCLVSGSFLSSFLAILAFSFTLHAVFLCFFLYMEAFFHIVQYAWFLVPCIVQSYNSIICIDIMLAIYPCIVYYLCIDTN